MTTTKQTRMKLCTISAQGETRGLFWNSESQAFELITAVDLCGRLQMRGIEIETSGKAFFDADACTWCGIGPRGANLFAYCAQESGFLRFFPGWYDAFLWVETAVEENGVELPDWQSRLAKLNDIAWEACK